MLQLLLNPNPMLSPLRQSPKHPSKTNHNTSARRLEDKLDAKFLENLTVSIRMAEPQGKKAALLYPALLCWPDGSESIFMEGKLVNDRRLLSCQILFGFQPWAGVLRQSGFSQVQPPGSGLDYGARLQGANPSQECSPFDPREDLERQPAKHYLECPVSAKTIPAL